MNRNGAVVLVLAAALAAGAWFLLGDRGQEEAPAVRPSAPVPVARPDAAAPPKPAPPAPSGILAGFVVREGRPAAASVAAWLLRRAPADPDSDAAWSAFGEGTDLHDGIEGTPRQTVAAGEDGKWSFRGLGPGEFHLEARAADGWRGSALVDLRSDGSPFTAKGVPVAPERIELHPDTCTIRGRALNPDGSGFGGFILVHADSDPAPARAGPEGRFRIEGLPPRMIRLAAFVPGVRQVPGPSVILPRAEEVVFTVGAGMAEVDGVVLEERTGAPVPGVALEESYGSYWDQDQGVEELTADDRGRFRARFPPAGGMTLAVTVPGFLPFREDYGDPGPGARKPVEVRLRRPASLSGQVVAEGGAPAAGAVVLVLVESGSRGGGSATRRATADARGRYEFRDLPADPVVVLGAGGGFLSKDLLGPAPWFRRDDAVVLREDGPVSRDLLVVPSARARGRLVDADGRGIAGAAVSTIQTNVSMNGNLPSEIQPEGEAMTGADGGFTVPYLVPGFPSEFLVTLAGRRLVRGTAPAGAPGAEVEVDLRVPRDRTLVVRVAEEGTDRPLAGVHVSVQAKFFGDPKDAVDGDWTTGADGTVRVGPVPSAPLVLYPFGQDPWWSGQEVEVAEAVDGPVVLTVDPLEMPGALPLEGRVLSPDGVPVPGAKVECGTDDKWTCMGFTGDSVFTDPGGRFKVAALHPGSYVLKASLSRDGREFSGEAHAAAGDADATVTLKDEARAEAGLDDGRQGDSRILLRVLGPSHRSLATGTVWMHFLGKKGQTDSPGMDLCDGMCSVALPPWSDGGTFWVEVSRAVESGDPALPAAHGVFGPFPSAPGPIELALAEGLTVEGRVVDPRGNGIPHAGVDLLHEWRAGPNGEVEGGGRIADNYADADGRFRLEGVGDRDYDLVASATPEWCGSKRTPVHGGAKGVTLVLRPAVAPLVTVLDPDGKPVQGAGVRTEQPREFGSWTPRETTGAAGMVRLDGMDPEAPCVLRVSPPNSRPDLIRRDLENWKPADTVVRLARGASLVVKVVDPAGQAVSDAVVWSSKDPSLELSWTYAAADADGVARLAHLVPGRIVLCAGLQEESRDSSGSRGKWRSPDTSVDAAVGTVVLVLDTGPEVRLRLRKGDGPVEGWVSLAGPGGGGAIRYARTEDGEVRIRGLTSGVAYAAYAVDDDAAEVAFVEGLKAGGEPVEVAMVPGLEIHGTVTGPRARSVTGVRVALGVLPLEADLDARAGTFKFTGIPPGRWKVLATLEEPEGESTIAADADAGGTVAIDAR